MKKKTEETAEKKKEALENKTKNQNVKRRSSVWIMRIEK